jgi:hypothetical protein
VPWYVQGRPLLMMLVARRLSFGRVQDIAIVDLEIAVQKVKDGWVCVGPDPASESALAQWLILHGAPLP